MRRSGVIAVCGVAALAGARAALGVSFNLTYDSTVSGRSDFASVQSAMNAATEHLCSALNDPITINVMVAAEPGILGQSTASYCGSYNWSQIRSALSADQTSTTDAIALASIPTTDATGGKNFYLTTAQGKALGVLGPSGDFDGTMIFGSDMAFTYDPAN